MNKQQETHFSKFLSFVLRHKPETIGLQLDENGWADVEELLSKSNQQNVNITLEALKQVVENNDKKRFAFSDDFKKIRASQGHSVNIDLQLIQQNPPEILFHGTAEKNIPSIREKGLLKGERNHVHLSLNAETAKNVGGRYGKPIVLKIKSKEMQEAGFLFYLSANNVWLTDHVPANFIIFD